MTTVTADLKAADLAISGRLTRDPKLGYSAKGNAWASFTLAVRLSRRDEDDEDEFYSVVCFGRLAENVAASTHKGDRVVAKGRFEEETWTAKDGTEQRGWKLVAEDVGLSLAFATAEPAKREQKPPAPAPTPTPTPAEKSWLFDEKEEVF